MISRIKHIGIMSQNAPRLFKFYECLFDLRKASNEVAPSQEAERGKKFGYPVLASRRVASPFDRTIIASDGNIGVAFKRRRPGYRGGLDHFGLQVDDLETVFARIEESIRPSASSKDPLTGPLPTTAPMIRKATSLTSCNRASPMQKAFGSTQDGSKSGGSNTSPCV
jgi:hypothetical protein